MLYEARFSEDKTILSRDLKQTTIAYAWLAELEGHVRYGFTTEKSNAHYKAQRAARELELIYNGNLRAAVTEVTTAYPA